MDRFLIALAAFVAGYAWRDSHAGGHSDIDGKLTALAAQLAAPTNRLAAAVAAMTGTPCTAKDDHMANAALDKLTDQVKKTEGVLDSAVAFVTGVPALIQAAVQAAIANGATAEELAPVTALGNDMAVKADAVAAAIAANPGPGSGPAAPKHK